MAHLYAHAFQKRRECIFFLIKKGLCSMWGRQLTYETAYGRITEKRQTPQKQNS